MSTPRPNQQAPVLTYQKAGDYYRELRRLRDDLLKLADTLKRGKRHAAAKNARLKAESFDKAMTIFAAAMNEARHGGKEVA